MSDFFVCTANKSPLHTHIEGRVWQLRAGLFIDVLPQRGRQREGVQEKKEREKARSKESSELTGQVNHLIRHALFTHTQLHRQLKLRQVNAADFSFRFLLKSGRPAQTIFGHSGTC